MATDWGGGGDKDGNRGNGNGSGSGGVPCPIVLAAMIGCVVLLRKTFRAGK